MAFWNRGPKFYFAYDGKTRAVKGAVSRELFQTITSDMEGAWQTVQGVKRYIVAEGALVWVKNFGDRTMALNVTDGDFFIADETR
jgi:hypothetical protein